MIAFCWELRCKQYSETVRKTFLPRHFIQADSLDGNTRSFADGPQRAMLCNREMDGTCFVGHRFFKYLNVRKTVQGNMLSEIRNVLRQWFKGEHSTLWSNDLGGK